ncbi:oxygenase MpaB family protein [Sphingomonas sp.]|uniref:oxygenase MpaB family protein n=1 Tax=Sphingomonas sp. TaxID=28214 RepID=UPI002CA92F4D|nr:oxygenase MpaB family protein [Sphingomonas sp.]HTG37546.1 oxygenase MpaB family protein [Sphingomonas sp.]
MNRSSLQGPLADLARSRLIAGVRSTFNDQSRGERPVQRSGSALFPADSVIGRVHGDVTTMMVGGIAALLMQMLDPAVLAGVWDHSRFRDDMLGRLRRTARFIAITTYADVSDAEAAIARVRQIHAHVAGILPDGTPYRADDPLALAWVHACEATCFLDAWIAFGEPSMSTGDQDRYFDQSALVAERLGAAPVPRSRSDMADFIQSHRSRLHVDGRTRDVARRVIRATPPDRATAVAQRVITPAAIDLLPAWARSMHELKGSGMARPFVAGGVRALAGSLRWAFRTRRD